MFFSWSIIFLFIVIAISLWQIGQLIEGFAYRKNPCAEFKSCKTCASAAACGWCSDLNVCQPMAQDGFSIRTNDSSTDVDVSDSPYTDSPRTEYEIKTAARASRIHICNPFGFITNADVCEIS